MMDPFRDKLQYHQIHFYRACDFLFFQKGVLPHFSMYKKLFYCRLPRQRHLVYWLVHHPKVHLSQDF